MSEPDIRTSGWGEFRGTVLTKLDDLQRVQNEMREDLKERDSRHSGRIGRVEKDIDDVHERITKVENGINAKFLAGLGAGILALAGWIVSLIGSGK